MINKSKNSLLTDLSFTYHISTIPSLNQDELSEYYLPKDLMIFTP